MELFKIENGKKVLDDEKIPGDVRDVSGAIYFWDIFMLGAYEGPKAQDNDPDGENMNESLTGWTTLDSGVDPTCFVFRETIRDFKDQPVFANMLPFQQLLDRTAAHEALHRFFGPHGEDGADDGIMDASGEIPFTQGYVTLTDEQIQLVQKKLYPK